MLYAYYVQLRDAFTLKFLLFLLTTQLAVKGLLYQIFSGVSLPIFKYMNVDAVQVQLYMTIASSPWSVKPLIGVVSDLISIRGYHKRYYLIACIVVGFASGFSLLFIPHDITFVSLFVLCFLGLNFQISISDLLSEGTYARLLNEHPETGSSIITAVNGMQSIGQVIALSFIGYLADINMYTPVFIIATIMCITPLVPTLLGWLPEEKVDTGKLFSVDWELWTQYKLPFLIVGITGLSGPVLAILTVYVNNIAGLVCAFIILSLTIAGAYIVFPPLVVKVALFQVIVQITKPSLGSALDFFFTADKQCLPGGPAFSFKYYTTYTGILGAFIAFISVILYQKYMSKWKFRNVLIFTSILAGLGGLSDLLIVLRVNIAMGISDKIFYIFGEAILENAVLTLFWIPSSAIISKSCPPNMESTTFAFLAGISNFGGMISSMLGAVIFKTAGIKTTHGHCNFESLWWLILVFHVCTRLAGGIGASFLIPNKGQTESLLDDSTEELTEELIEIPLNEDDDDLL